MSYMKGYSTWLQEGGMSPDMSHVKQYHRENPHMIPPIREKVITKLETTDMFSDRSSVNEAFQYLDDILETVQAEGGDRIAAYTGAYVLYNTVVNHYNKQLEEDT